jgi:hypothetical protein
MATDSTQAKRRPLQFSLKLLLGFMTWMCLSCCVCSMVFRRFELSDVSRDEANAALNLTAIPAIIPERASHVDVRGFFQGVETSFQIGEEDFLDWAKPKWEVERVNLGGDPKLVVKDYPYNWPVNVTSAYYFTRIAPRGNG